MTSLTESYDRETRRRAQAPKPPAPRNPGMVRTNPSTGIMAQLRNYNDHSEVSTPDEESEFSAPVVSRPAYAATSKQIGFVHVLLRKLDDHNPMVARTAREWFLARVDTITVPQISDVILRLKGHLAVTGTDESSRTSYPWTEWRTLAAQLVEFGGRHGARFAVDTEDGATNSIAFWWIVPNEGPRGMRYFLRQVIGGQGPVRVTMPPEAMVRIAKKIIAADPAAAMIRYGQEIGECGHCGRTLTNDESRADGIGPVCKGKKGW